ncbi:hypothetical protein [Thermogemmatispora tikiterensis]|nr:hypothetical protein [Thermogemmatispora tikiterensis]
MTERFGPARIWVVPPTIFGSKVRAIRRERRRMAQLRSKLVFLLPLDDQELLHQGALSQLIHSTTSLLVDCHLIPHRPWSDSPSSDWSRLDQLPSEIAIAELVKTLKRDSVQLLVLVCPHQGHCHLWLELVVLTAILTSEFQVQWVILTKGGADEQKESVLRLVDPLLCLVDPLL